MLKLTILFVSMLLELAPPIQEQPETPQAFAERHAGEDGALGLQEVRAALAEVELQVVVQRDQAEADRRLARLTELAVEGIRRDSRDAEAGEVYLLVQEAHIDLRMERGMEPDFWRPDSASTAETSADERELDLALEQLNSDPRIAARRESWDAQRAGGAGPSPPGEDRSGGRSDYTIERDELTLAVETALQRGDMMFIQELGKRAAPALARAVAGDLALVVQLGHDPLWQLAIVDPATAVATMRAHFDEGGPIWRMRVLRTLHQARQAWFNWSKLPMEDLVPGQLELWERLAWDPDLATETLGKLPPAWRGGLSPALIDMGVRDLDSEDRERRAAAASCLFGEAASLVVVPLAEAALDSAHADVRLAAARQLTYLPWNDALAARGDDPDSGVRLHVARMLGVRRLNSYDATFVRRDEKFGPVLDETGLRVLRKLLLDPDRAVRLQAAKVLPNWPTETVNVELPAAGAAPGVRETVSVRRILLPPSAEELDGLAHDPSQEVQEKLIPLAASLAPEEGLAVLRVLVTSDNAWLAGEVLSSVPSSWYRSHPAEVLELVRAYRHWPEPTLNEIRNLRRDLGRQLSPLIVTTAGLESVFRWAVAERGWVPDVLSSLREFPGDRLGPELTPQTYAGYLAAIDDGRHEELLGALLVDPVERMSAVYEALAADSERSSFARALAALALGRWRGQGWQRSFLEALHDPFWSQASSVEASGIDLTRTTEVTDRSWRLKTAFKALPLERANALGLELARDDEAEPSAVDYLLGTAPLGAAGGAELALAIRARWSVSDLEQAESRAVTHVIVTMAEIPELRDDAYLELAIENPQYANDVVETIRRLRDPAHLALLRRVLTEQRGTWLWGHTVREVLPSFLTDESAEMLLEAAALAEDEKTREACLDNLERMRAYFLARDYWAERKQLRDTTEAAKAELLELLDSNSDTVRVHALRALAGFRAVEAVPRMIRLLEDSSPAVAEAAAEALEMLNRPEPTRVPDPVDPE